MNFLLQFATVDPSETELRARFAKLGIGAGKNFDASKLPPDIQEALQDGMADAWKEFEEFKKTEIDTGKRPAAEAFGTRDYLKNDYMARMTGAALGIYGNSKQEALYPAYFTDAAGEVPHGSKHRYTLRFPPGKLPPVNAFWSVTMYELPASLLYANPINRYLVNSPMLPNLERDADGGVTLYIQHESPSADKEANWLPAPSGPFLVIMRLYWPKQEALNGTWKQPPLEGAN